MKLTPMAARRWTSFHQSGSRAPTEHYAGGHQSHCTTILCNVRVIGNAATYADARVKLHQAEYTSDLTDTEDGSRKRKACAKVQSQASKQPESSEHSDSEEELPPTPPEKLLRPAPKKITSRVASSLVQPVSSPTAQRVTSSPVQPVSSPTAQRVVTNMVQRVASPSCEAMFSKLLTLVEEMKETQWVHGKMLNALLKKQDASQIEVPEGVVFPLKTQADVEALDEKLEDRSLMSAVVAMVADVGGTSVDDATRRMMKYVISHELAMEYNMFGRHFSVLCMRLLRRTQ